MNATEISKLLKSNGFELTKTTTGVYTWWFEGAAIAEDNKKSEAAYQAHNFYILLGKRSADAEIAIPCVLGDNRARIEELESQLAKAQADLGEHRVERLVLLNKVETLEFDDKIKADSIDNLHNENVKLKADLAAAQSIIVQAQATAKELVSEAQSEIISLKIENARMKAHESSIAQSVSALETLAARLESDGLVPMSYGLSARLSEIWGWLGGTEATAPQAPSPAQAVTVKCLNCGNPVSHDFCDTKCYQEYKYNQEKLVTLSEREIEWLAKHVSSASPDRYYSKEAAESNWRKTPSVVNRVVSLSGTGITYVLSPEYDTQANRAAIVAKRAELGLA